ncbi:MAG: hypothetical protein JO118_00165 [Acetobacteraceae bacterium]|nr:hypothetical protein [Acetobacteraceae bacterium]
MRHLFLLALTSGLICIGMTAAHAQSQYPIMDRVAERVIQKYQSSSCQQIAARRAQRPTGRREEMEQRVVQLLHQDPQMREAFLNRVAAPIANKLFECGMIP